MTKIKVALDSKFLIRTMDLDDLEKVMGWVVQEGWNPGLHDAGIFYHSDPEGFLIGELDGEPIASLSTVAYNENYGFLGLYLVRPPFRGNGYGFKIWQAGMAYMGVHRNVGLQCYAPQVENFEKSGYRLTSQYSRYEGLGEISSKRDVVDLCGVDFFELVSYDMNMFPVERAQFLERWISQEDSLSLGIMHQGHLAGYGVLRRAYRGFKIGPLFADSQAFAEKLYKALSSQVPGELIILDVPDSNPAAIRLVQKYGLEKMEERCLLYNQVTPHIDLKRIFGVTTYELG